MTKAPIVVPLTYTENPFRGPTPFRAGDPIFGRERELKVLLNQVLSDRLVLLHSSSGCGKTSLVEAGLKSRLQNTLQIFPTASLKGTTGATERPTTLTERLLQYRNLQPVSTPKQGADEPACEFKFFFFDQFEEVLASKDVTEEERTRFFKELGLWLESRKLWALFAIREDYLGDLQPYLRFLPGQLSSRFRLTQLTVGSAAEAMEMRQKADKRNGMPPGSVRIAFTAEAALRLARNLAGTTDGERGAPSGLRPIDIVEPVLLQVVCQSLWEKGTVHPIVSIPDEGISGMTVSGVLADYYRRSVETLAGGDDKAQFRIRKWFDNDLIDTVDLRRLRVRIPANSPSIKGAELDILRDQYLIRDDQPSAPTNDRMVELAHDRLIAPIVDDNKRYFSPLEQDWLKAARLYKREPKSVQLLRGDALRKAESWAYENPARMSEEASSFLMASVREQGQYRTIRRMAMIAAGSIMLALAVIGYSAFLQFKTSERMASVQQLADQTSRSAEKTVNDANLKAKEVENRAAGVEASASMATAAAANAVEEARRQTTLAQKAKEKLEADSALIEASAREQMKAAEEDHIAAQGALNYASKMQHDAVVEVAAQKARAVEYQASASSIKALSSAKQQQSLTEALRALQLATHAGEAARQPDGKGSNLLQEAAATARALLSRSLLKRTLCLPNYVQSFGVLSGSGQLLAIDEHGNRYNNASIANCPAQAALPGKRFEPRPNVSAIAQTAEVEAAGDFDGNIQILLDGIAPAGKIKLRQQVVALTLSADGHFAGAASSFWSIGVWRVHNGAASRVLQWPGTAWNPLAWMRWIRIFQSTGNQRNNVLAIHVNEAAPTGAAQGYLAEGREDGCLALVPVRIDGKHLTQPRVQENCDRFNPITALSISPDGSLLATGSKSGSVILWKLSLDPAQWNRINNLPRVLVAGSETGKAGLKGCGSRVASLQFLHNGADMLTVGCPDGTVQVFDLSRPTSGLGANYSFEPLETLQGAIGGVTTQSFDTRTNILYTAGSSRQVEAWAIPTPQGFRDRRRLSQELQDLEQEAQTKFAGELQPKVERVIFDVCAASPTAAGLDQCNSVVGPK